MGKGVILSDVATLRDEFLDLAKGRPAVGPQTILWFCNKHRPPISEDALEKVIVVLVKEQLIEEDYQKDGRRMLRFIPPEERTHDAKRSDVPVIDPDDQEDEEDADDDEDPESERPLPSTRTPIVDDLVIEASLAIEQKPTPQVILDAAKIVETVARVEHSELPPVVQPPAPQAVMALSELAVEIPVEVLGRLYIARQFLETVRGTALDVAQDQVFEAALAFESSAHAVMQRMSVPVATTDNDPGPASDLLQSVKDSAHGIPQSPVRGRGRPPKNKGETLQGQLLDFFREHPRRIFSKKDINGRFEGHPMASSVSPMLSKMVTAKLISREGRGSYRLMAQ